MIFWLIGLNLETIIPSVGKRLVSVIFENISPAEFSIFPCVYSFNDWTLFEFVIEIVSTLERYFPSIDCFNLQSDVLHLRAM